MEGCVIPEPERPYLLERLDALGPAADDFVVAGAQAKQFVVDSARGTKDVDFLLSVMAARKEYKAQLFRTYDGNGQRVEKVGGGNTIITIFAGAQVLAEYYNGAAP